MASIRLGNIVSRDTPDTIKRGVLFRLFDARCTQFLNKEPLNISGPFTPYKNKIPRHSKKTEYKNYEAQRQYRVNDPGGTVFAKRNTCLRMKLKMAGKCPWFDCSTFTLNLYVEYSEAISPVYYPIAPATQIFDPWPKNTNYRNTITTTPYNFGWPDRGSSGSGSARFELFYRDSEPANPCAPPNIDLVATLLFLGRDYDYLAGTPAIQLSSLPCFTISDNTGSFSRYWTAYKDLTSVLGPGQFLVMTLAYTIRGVPGSQTGCPL
jgi:hypothetical protein